MDGQTLRAGYKAIADYMGDRGMMPEPQGAPSAPGGGGEAPEGTRIKVGNKTQVKRGGKWVDE
jgi:hypothetical protein